MALAIIPVKVIEALLERTARRVEHTHAPFSHTGSCIALLLKEFGDGQGLFWQRHLAIINLSVGADRGVPHVETCHQRGAGGGADRGAGIRLCETSAFSG